MSNRTGPRTPLLPRLATATLLAASVVGAVRVARDMQQRVPLHPPEQVQAFTNPAEQPKRAREMIGTFATGSRPGDRVIVIADGNVRFHPVGPLAKPLELSDRYVLGYRDRTLCLATSESGTIEVLDIDRLSYFGDVYQRR